MIDKINNHILQNLFDDFIAENTLTDIQQVKVNAVKHSLGALLKSNNFIAFKIQKNELGKIEMIATTDEFFVDPKERINFVLLIKLCDIDIDSKDPDNIALNIKFTIKED